MGSGHSTGAAGPQRTARAIRQTVGRRAGPLEGSTLPTSTATAQGAGVASLVYSFELFSK